MRPLCASSCPALRWQRWLQATSRTWTMANRRIQKQMRLVIPFLTSLMILCSAYRLGTDARKAPCPVLEENLYDANEAPTTRRIRSILFLVPRSAGGDHVSRAAESAPGLPDGGLSASRVFAAGSTA